MTIPMPSLALKRRTRTAPEALTGLVEATEHRARGLARQAVDGSLSPAAFGDRMAELLEDAHAHAAYLGRFHAGDTAPPEADDRRFAETVVDGQAEFLARFMQDLEGGRYAESAEGAAARAALYASRLVGTSNEVFILASDDTLWEWVLGASEQHCPDCPGRAAGGPYTAEALAGMGYPGSGSTACKVRCRCSVRRADGREGFRAAGE